MEIPSDTIIKGINLILKLIDKSRKPIYLGDFFRRLEKKLHSSLSEDSKEKIFQDLNAESRIIQNKKGKYLVTLRPVEDYY